ncbi:uncharacterized protein AMSG_03963 [Thecamonas trahens ATCC 50062]|uniref:LIM zinc-binding domain-containing protein n=1 Tax=Thecamonas trahens ATCC 50062 TaxID=461836 RepID=A0A0L0D6N0_THETB|nr:hypothetical protein AMSG_03963 [Thecamonas trahens ATCC 50062]KNC47736.1 hypothetical protein AMSG_03963 [Thecamonas trahens ATCC 50062]|eukprot:XP_013759214.1 hypothetical protein AMSG_03963 [Thecamonas trahens ATCC 50062]
MQIWDSPFSTLAPRRASPDPLSGLPEFPDVASRLAMSEAAQQRSTSPVWRQRPVTPPKVTGSPLTPRSPFDPARIEANRARRIRTLSPMAAPPLVLATTDQMEAAVDEADQLEATVSSRSRSRSHSPQLVLIGSGESSPTAAVGVAVAPRAAVVRVPSAGALPQCDGDEVGLSSHGSNTTIVWSESSSSVLSESMLAGLDELSVSPAVVVSSLDGRSDDGSVSSLGSWLSEVSSETAISDIVVEPQANPYPDFGPMIEFFDKLGRGEFEVLDRAALEASHKTVDGVAKNAVRDGEKQALSMVLSKASDGGENQCEWVASRRVSLSSYSLRKHVLGSSAGSIDMTSSVHTGRSRSRSMSSWSGRRRGFQWSASEAEISAATLIQASFRGFKRKKDKFRFVVPEPLTWEKVEEREAKARSASEALLASLADESPARELLAAMNEVRADPGGLADALEERLQYFKNGVLWVPGVPMGIMTMEGRAGQDDAIAFTRQQAALEPLALSPVLCLVAAMHASDIGSKGMTGSEGSDGRGLHERVCAALVAGGVAASMFEAGRPWRAPSQAAKAPVMLEQDGEACELAVLETFVYKGWSSARDAVVQMAVDDGLRTRHRRKALFNSRMTHVGIAVGPHVVYGSVTVMVYSSGGLEQVGRGIEGMSAEEGVQAAMQLSAERNGAMALVGYAVRQTVVSQAYTEPSLECPGCHSAVGSHIGKVYVGQSPWHSECSSVCRVCLSGRAHLLKDGTVPTCSECFHSLSQYRCDACAQPLVDEFVAHKERQRALCLECFQELNIRSGNPTVASSSRTPFLERRKTVGALTGRRLSVGEGGGKSAALVRRITSFKLDEWVGQRVRPAPVQARKW